MHFRQVVILVPRIALDRSGARAVGPSTYLHGVTITVVTLSREVTAEVAAIHATRVSEDSND
jgi:hypothetical protein